MLQRDRAALGPRRRAPSRLPDGRLPAHRRAGRGLRRDRRCRDALQPRSRSRCPTDVVLARILGRRVCPTCGTTTSAPREVARSPMPSWRRLGGAPQGRHRDRDPSAPRAVRRGVALPGEVVRRARVAPHRRRSGEPRQRCTTRPSRRCAPRSGATGSLLGERACSLAARLASPLGSARPTPYFTTMFSIPGFGRRELRIHLLECVDEQLCDRDGAHPLAVGRHHVPRRPLRRGLGDRLLVGLLVPIPQGAVVEVRAPELPVLLGIVDAAPGAVGAARPARCAGTPSRSVVPSSASIRSNSRM